MHEPSKKGGDKVPKVLSIGASGRFAGMVIPELAKRGAFVRGLIRDKTKIQQVKNAGANEIAIGDLANIDSIEQALSGMDSVF